MKRIQLFEFTDFDWFPSVFRTGITNLIVVFHKMMKSDEVLAGLIRKVQKKYAFSQIVDIGSGSGGAMPMVLKKLAESGEKMHLLMSDLHPNPSYMERVNAGGNKYIKYHTASLLS